MRYFGSIYFVRIGQDIKIGYSENVMHRVKQLRREEDDTELLGVVDCVAHESKRPHPLEVLLWKRWALFRRGGEWFSTATPLVNWIAKLPKPLWLDESTSYFSNHEP